MAGEVSPSESSSRAHRECPIGLVCVKYLCEGPYEVAAKPGDAPDENQQNRTDESATELACAAPFLY